MGPKLDQPRNIQHVFTGIYYHKSNQFTPGMASGRYERAKHQPQHCANQKQSTSSRMFMISTWKTHKFSFNADHVHTYGNLACSQRYNTCFLYVFNVLSWNPVFFFGQLNLNLNLMRQHNCRLNAHEFRKLLMSVGDCLFVCL